MANKKVKKHKNYQGGKKLNLNIDGVAEEIYYKRIDSKKIIEETYKKVTLTPDKEILKRKLFVVDDDTEKEFTYKYITETGNIYEGNTLKGILDLKTDKVRIFDGKRFLEFDKWGDEHSKNDYIVEEEYNLYPIIKEETNLFKLAEKMFKEKKVAICKFNPNGSITGLGFLYIVAEMIGNKIKYSLVCAYARLKKNRHLIYLDNKGYAVKRESIEVIEV